MGETWFPPRERAERERRSPCSSSVDDHERIDGDGAVCAQDQRVDVNGGDVVVLESEAAERDERRREPFAALLGEP